MLVSVMSSYCLHLGHSSLDAILAQPFVEQGRVSSMISGWRRREDRSGFCYDVERGNKDLYIL